MYTNILPDDRCFILIILTCLFVFPVSNDQLCKNKTDSCSERVVEHIIKFKQSPSGKILRDLDKGRKRSAENRSLYDRHLPESVSGKYTERDEHDDVACDLLEPVIAIFVEKLVIFPQRRKYTPAICRFAV